MIFLLLTEEECSRLQTFVSILTSAPRKYFANQDFTFTLPPWASGQLEILHSFLIEIWQKIFNLALLLKDEFAVY